jgi:hypothetical protein
VTEIDTTDDVQLAGHAVLYTDGTLAFHADNCEHVIGGSGLCEHIRNVQLPPMLLPVLSKVLDGGPVEKDDLPSGGPFMALAKVMGGWNRGG